MTMCPTGAGTSEVPTQECSFLIASRNLGSVVDCSVVCRATTSTTEACGADTCCACDAFTTAKERARAKQGREQIRRRDFKASIPPAYPRPGAIGIGGVSAWCAGCRCVVSVIAAATIIAPPRYANPP